MHESKQTVSCIYIYSCTLASMKAFSGKTTDRHSYFIHHTHTCEVTNRTKVEFKEEPVFWGRA